MITSDTYQSKAALVKGNSPLPFFRDPHHDTNVQFTSEVPEKYRQNPGIDCGFRILPYHRQDRYTRTQELTTIPLIRLENQFLKASFLPSLGGRLISLFDKEGNRELLASYTNIQSANLATRDAWFAGGIEWNVGQYGHSTLTQSPVHFAAVDDNTLRMFAFERVKELWYQIDFHLPENSRLLFATVRIVNRNESKRSLYYWTNTAIPQTPHTRVFASSSDALALDTTKPGSRSFSMMRHNHFPALPDIDPSYPEAFPISDEYFFTCSEDPMPWEAGVEADGKGFFEASTPNLCYRKLFVWGESEGGRNWQRYLSPARPECKYAEIQAGLAPSQLHALFLDSGKSISWTQAFGSLDTKSNTGRDYDMVHEEVSQSVKRCTNAHELAKMHTIFTLDLDKDATHILALGTPDTARECKERGWTDLLESKVFPMESPIGYEPPESFDQEFYTGPFWLGFLAKKAKGSDNPYLLYQYAVALVEAEQREEAKHLFAQSAQMRPSAYPLRALALLFQSESEAEKYYEKAEQCSDFYSDPGFGEEYLTLLLKNGEDKKARQILDKIPNGERTSRLLLITARLAAIEKDAKTLEQILFTPIAGIREAETPLGPLYDAYIAILHPELSRTEREVQYPLPSTLNFRMF